MTEHVCEHEWSEGIDREFVCMKLECDARLTMEQAKSRLNEYETRKERPSIKISDGDVWLVFPNTTISIEGICRFGTPGPIVKRNLREWREGILEGNS